MKTRASILAGSFLLVLLSVMPMPAPAQGSILMHRSVIAQGAFDGSGTTMALRGTVGQSVAARAGERSISGLYGFWYGVHRVLEVPPGSPDRSALRIEALWPQPASERLRLRISTRQPQVLQLTVTDMLGRCLVRKVRYAVPGDADTESLPVASLHPGVYLLTIQGVHECDALCFVVLR